MNNERMEYEKAVTAHMIDAPQELREYVRRKVYWSPRWQVGFCPIDYCGFYWRESEEGFNFWDAVHQKQWLKATSTDFWQSYKKNQFKVSTQINLIKQAYLLIVDYKEHSVYINPQSAFDKASEIIKNTVPPPMSIEVRGIDVIGVD